MHRLKLLVFVACLISGGLMAQGVQEQMPTPFEKNGTNTTTTYAEMMTFYKGLAAASPMVKIFDFENGTDVGKPLNLVVITGTKIFNPVPLRQADVRIVMIMNGIHPGEPDGIDASMMLARDLVLDKAYATLLEHFAICIIPAYNVDGMLVRNSVSRANQNGPESYGFRGNGQNLDLNRDFIKQDSKNARAFAKMYTEWRPDLFIDTHTSNGADYQYIMTYIATMKEKLDPALANYMETILNPEVTAKMKEANYEMCPYVQTLGWDMVPDSGISTFYDSPRYSTGYASLFGAMAYTTESHMLKKHEDRVYGTYHLMMNLLKIVNRDRKIVGRMRKEAIEALKKQTEFTLKWKLDPKISVQIPFKGFTASISPSTVTGFPRIGYDETLPFTKNIPFYNHYFSEVTVTKPTAYIVPQAWDAVVERLKLSGVAMSRLSEDVTTEVAMYKITKYDAADGPYEGHFPLGGIEVKKENQQVQFWAGDYVIYTDQEANRFIVETLEPLGMDSYLSWNFFDPILSRKEYFSPYIFDTEAHRILEADPKLKQELQDKIKADTAFAKSDWLQMSFVFEHSKHMEPVYMRYPVARLEKGTKLPIAK
jgi:Zinc carboxypeptidase